MIQHQKGAEHSALVGNKARVVSGTAAPACRKKNPHSGRGRQILPANELPSWPAECTEGHRGSRFSARHPGAQQHRSGGFMRLISAETIDRNLIPLPQEIKQLKGKQMKRCISMKHASAASGACSSVTLQR